MFLEDDVLNVIAGQYIQRSCVSKDGKPPSVIGWAITENNSTSIIRSWLGDSLQKFDISRKCIGLFYKFETQSISMIRQKFGMKSS